jgi:carbon monoxide dehydrogenase subunit G
MELSNEFRVNAPIDEAWAVLTDIELIAPCLPGAQLTEVDGETYSGQVKVKVGPITAQYKGSAVFSTKDDANHRAVIDAKGRDTRGQGNASAEVTAQLTADGDAATNVAITTDLKLSGKVAQFGRGVLADVSEKLLGEFQVCLEGKLAAGATGGAAGDGATGADASAGGGTDAGASASPGQGAATGPRRIEMPEPEPVDLLETAGAPVIKRLIPIVIVVLVLLLLLRRRRRS